MHRIISVLAGATLLLGGTGSAYASPPAAAGGTFASTVMTSFHVRQAGQITVMNFSTTGFFTGTLTGTFEDEINAVINLSANKVVGLGTGTCACTVAGRSGTLEYSLESSGPFDAQAFDGRMVITRATGDLSGFHGAFELAGVVAPNMLATVDYSGEFHLDP